MLTLPLPPPPAATVAKGKAFMKAALQERLGLALDPSAPLLGFVGRLTEQKGVDVLLAAAPALLTGPAAAAPSRWRPEGVETAAAVAGAGSNQPALAASGGAGAGTSPPALQMVLLGTGEVRRLLKDICCRHCGCMPAALYVGSVPASPITYPLDPCLHAALDGERTAGAVSVLPPPGRRPHHLFRRVCWACPPFPYFA